MKSLKTLFLSVILFLVSFAQTKAQAGTLNKSLSHLTDSYEGIKSALAANNGVAAENKAKEFIQALNEVPVKEMKPGQLKVWSKYIDQLEFDSRHISEVPRVPHQKEQLILKNSQKTCTKFWMHLEWIGYNDKALFNAIKSGDLFFMCRKNSQGKLF